MEWLGLFRFPSGASCIFQHLVPKVEQCTAQKAITRLGSLSVVPMWFLRKEQGRDAFPCVCPTPISNNYVSLKTLIERLEYGREVLSGWWRQEIEMVQKAMGFRFPAQIH